MRFLIVFLLFLLFAPLALAGEAYHTDPQHPGRHYDCSKGAVVAYENSDVILLCDGLNVHKKRGLFRTMNTWSFLPANAFAKVPEGASLTEAEAMAIVRAQFEQPFYDTSERRMVKIKGVAIAADALTTAVGLNIGNCSEAGPLKHVPYLGLAIGVGDVIAVRHIAKGSPRFFTTSRDYLNYAPAVTHGAAALNNLFRCIL